MIWILYKAADWNLQPVPVNRASVQIPIKLHSNFRWQCIKAWKLCLAWFWQQMKSKIWKLCRDLHWQDKLKHSIWIFLQSAFENNHLLCYWTNIQDSILKICLTQKISSRLQYMTKNILFSFGRSILTLAKWIRQVTVSQGKFQQGAENPCSL